jgi:RNA polymerase sigma-70 factor (ECF subfamily)
MDTDDELIAGLATDLDRTFEALVLAHQDRLYTIALRTLGDPSDAEEAAQDALVRAYRALARYDGARILELRLRPWLATIVLNICRSRRTRTVRVRSTLSLDVPLPAAIDPRADSASGPAATADRRASARIWSGLLLGLPPAQRTAVILRHVDGLTYPELAEVLGRPEGTVKAQVHRGLVQLRAAYDAADRLHPEETTA